MVGPLARSMAIPLYGGLDLSEAADLTALVLIGKRDGKWRVQPTFWLPSEGLSEKSVADRVPYDMWARQGYLQTTPGRSISYEFVASYLRDVFQALRCSQARLRSLEFQAPTALASEGRHERAIRQGPLCRIWPGSSEHVASAT